MKTDSNSARFQVRRQICMFPHILPEGTCFQLRSEDKLFRSIDLDPRNHLIYTFKSWMLIKHLTTDLRCYIQSFPSYNLRRDVHYKIPVPHTWGFPGRCASDLHDGPKLASRRTGEWKGRKGQARAGRK